jgi:hypothetical protein
MSFQIRGLDPILFEHLFGQSDEDLAAQNITRHRVDTFPAFPDRITLEPIKVGGSALLLNFEHLPVQSPYRSRHAIYVQEGADRAFDAKNTLPPILKASPMALRGIDGDGCIQDAELVEGEAVYDAIERMFADDTISYIHAHFAARGCFAAKIDRA